MTPEKLKKANDLDKRIKGLESALKKIEDYLRTEHNELVSGLKEVTLVNTADKKLTLNVEEVPINVLPSLSIHRTQEEFKKMLEEDKIEFEKM
jgi:hypothetical protein